MVEIGKDRYAASQHTKTLADAGIASTLDFFYTISNPSFHALPDLLEENGYQSPANGISAFHKSFGTDLNFFAWAKKNPAVLKLLQGVISVVSISMSLKLTSMLRCSTFSRIFYVQLEIFSFLQPFTKACWNMKR